MEQRKRLNAKQTAAGLWQLDVTVEYTDGTVDPDIAATGLLLAVEAVEKEFKTAGKKLVGG